MFIPIKKISVVTPSYNQDKFIAQTINSIWQQRGNFELEHIIADGGSTDNTVGIIKRFAELYKNKKFPFKCRQFSFVWWSKKDRGQTDALNRGFTVATGDIFCWLNSDDLYYRSDSLSKVIKTYTAHPSSDIVVGNTRFINELNKDVDNFILSNNKNNQEFQKILPNIIDLCILPQPSVFFKKEVYHKYKLNNYYYGMDWDLWIRCYKDKTQFYKINETLANFRIHKSGKTTIQGKKYYEEIIAILKKHHPQSKQILINRLLLLNSVIKPLPFLGPISSTLFDFFLDSYLFIKKKVFKKITPIFINQS